MKARGAGTIDAYGNPTGGGGNDNNNTKLPKPTSGVVTNTGIVGSNAMKTPEEIKKEEEKKKQNTGIILAKRRNNINWIYWSRR